MNFMNAITPLVSLIVGWLLTLDPCFTTPVPDVTSCREPDDFDRMLVEFEVLDHLSVVLPPPIRQELDNMNRKTTTEMSSVFTGPDQMLYGNKTCPSELPHTYMSLIQDRSTCPFYYVISQDATRYPPAIAEARCKCSACVDGSGGDNLCEGIYFQKTILRKTGCSNGIYTYAPETYNVQNGCICTGRILIPNAAEQNDTQTTETENEGEEDDTERTGTSETINHVTNTTQAQTTGTTSLPFNVH